jgi:hypothetical protein
MDGEKCLTGLDSGGCREIVAINEGVNKVNQTAIRRAGTERDAERAEEKDGCHVWGPGWSLFAPLCPSWPPVGGFWLIVIDGGVAGNTRGVGRATRWAHANSALRLKMPFYLRYLLDFISYYFYIVTWEM